MASVEGLPHVDDVLANDVLRETLQLLRRVGHERISSLGETIERTQEFSPELWRLLAELGIPSMAFAEKDGGGGGTYLTYVCAMEEIARASACAALYAGPTVQVASAITRYGTEAQRAAWGRPLMEGRALGAWAFTEPETGSDPRQIRTRAVRQGSSWVLDGGKMFISFAAHADVALVFAKTDDERLSAFLVDTANEGWQPGSPLGLMALGGMGTAPVAIDSLRVPADSLLGEEGAGFEILVDTEAEGKIRASAICTGIASRALEESVRYASQRLHRGTPIGAKFPTVQSLLGGMAAQIEAARALVRHAAHAVDRGDPQVKVLAAATRIVCARVAREVTSDAMQVCGAYGFTKDMVVERLYREGKFYEVGQGVIELQRIIVGKRHLADFARTGAVRPQP